MANAKKNAILELVKDFNIETQKFRDFLRSVQNNSQREDLFHSFSTIETEMLQALEGSPVRFWGDHSLRETEFEYAQNIIKAFKNLNEALQNPAYDDANAINSAITGLLKQAGTNKDQKEQPVQPRSWGYLFLGTVLGALAGAVIAMLMVFCWPYLTLLCSFVIFLGLDICFYYPFRRFIASVAATLPVASILSYFDPLDYYAPRGEAIFPSAHTFFLSGLIGAGIGAVAGFGAAYYYSSSAYQNYSFFSLKAVEQHTKSFSQKLDFNTINSTVRAYRLSLPQA